MARDNTYGFSAPVQAPPITSLDARRYTYNRQPGVSTPTQPVPPTTPTPVVTPPPPAGIPVGGNQGAGAIGSSPTNPQQTMTDYIRNNVSGDALYKYMKNLPDAYKFAMYNALSGTGGNYDPTSGHKGQNDLWGALLANDFNNNQNQMNQWINYWSHINPSAKVQFDPSTGKFHNLDLGYDLSQQWMYQNNLNDFWKQEGTGQSQWKTLEDFGLKWDPSAFAKIGDAPWWEPPKSAITGTGINPVPNVTPPLTPASSTAGPNPMLMNKPNPAPGTVMETPPNPFALSNTAAGPGTAPQAPAPAITAPPPVSTTNPTPAPGNQYRFQPGMWGRQN